MIVDNQYPGGPERILVRYAAGGFGSLPRYRVIRLSGDGRRSQTRGAAVSPTRSALASQSRVPTAWSSLRGEDLVGRRLAK